MNNFCFHHKESFGCFSKAFIGHDARIAPSSTLENPAKIFICDKII